MELKQGYKKTEIGIIPEDWEIKKLSEITTLITKGTTPKKFTDTGVTFVKIESLSGDEINIEKCLYIDDTTHKTDLKRSILNEGDLLFAIAGATIGKCTTVPKEILPANTNQALAIIRLKDNENKKYVFYFLKSKLMQKYIIDNIAGGAQPNLNLAQVGGYFFPLPPTKAEQTAIATTLSDTDALIESLENLIAKKRLIKQGAMQELLKPKEGWEVKRLGEIGEIKMCKRIFSHQTKEHGDIPFFKIGTFGSEPDAFISNDIYIEFKQRFSFPKKGDILISAAGTIGRTVVYNGEPSYFQDSNIVWIDNKEDLVSNHFLFYILQIVNYNTEGGTIQRLYNSILRNTEFNCPPKKEQTRIATILSDMDKEIEALEAKLEKYRKIRVGMMQQLLTGKIRLV